VTVGYIKRHLEAETDRVLDSVRLYGCAVLLDRAPAEQPYSLLARAEQYLRTVWLCVPSPAAAEWRAEAERARAESVDGSTDLDWDCRDALEDAVGTAVDALAEWLEAYGLRVDWSAAGLCVYPERGEEL
jgi:hypothetical protein